MSFFTEFFSKLKRFIFPQGIVQEKFGVAPATSKKMEENINLWYAMLMNKPPWKSDSIVPLGIPAAICREIARPTLVEFKADISGSPRADYLMECFQEASEGFIRQMEIGLAVGGIAFKPYPFRGKILVDATSASGFQPTHFDASGACIGGIFKDKPVKVGDQYYIRLEYHDLQDTIYTIKNKAFCSDTNGTVGKEVSLQNVPEWADMQPETKIANMEGPLFAYFKTPKANNVDENSGVGVSMYSGAAVDLIQQADEQWQMLRWEYRSGKRKIFADEIEGIADQFDRDLFERGVFSNEGGFFEVFSPDFRDDQIYQGFQNILKQIEFDVGLSFGTISDPQSVEKTATEERHSKERMYNTVHNIQISLTHTFNTLIYAMDVYATLYGLAPAGTYKAEFDWGDSVLDDEETIRLRNQDMRADVAAGILRKEIYLSKKYGVTEEEARKMIPDMEDMTDETQNEVE